MRTNKEQTTTNNLPNIEPSRFLLLDLEVLEIWSLAIFSNSAISHKIDYVAHVQDISKNNQNHIIGSKVMAIFLNGGFCILDEFHREGFASTGHTAGLF